MAKRCAAAGALSGTEPNDDLPRGPEAVAGTFAINGYTGINRATKDIDIFCKVGDFPRILLHFKDRGFGTEIEDERWCSSSMPGST